MNAEDILRHYAAGERDFSGIKVKGYNMRQLTDFGVAGEVM